MFELKVKVIKVMGDCTANPQMKAGDYFTVRDGDIQIPEGGYICLWALQSLIPLITPKERKIGEDRDQDWMWRVNHAQCPDPKGRVIFKVEQTGEFEKTSQTTKTEAKSDLSELVELDLGHTDQDVKTLRIEVDRVKGKCTSKMQVGDFAVLRSGRLYIPPGRHFCLYCLHAAMPLLPAKQRALRGDDWMMQDSEVICPDPAGNTILRIKQME